MPAEKKPASKFTGHIDLKGSARKIPAGKNMGGSNLNELIEVTVRLRRKKAIEDYVSAMEKHNKVLTREEFDELFGAQEKDVQKVESFAAEHDLTVVQSSIGRRTVVLKGTVQNFSSAFGVYLSDYQHDDGKVYRGRVGVIKIPRQLEGIVEGIFGLDNRPQTRPMFRMVKK